MGLLHQRNVWLQDPIGSEPWVDATLHDWLPYLSSDSPGNAHSFQPRPQSWRTQKWERCPKMDHSLLQRAYQICQTELSCPVSLESHSAQVQNALAWGESLLVGIPFQESVSVLPPQQYSSDDLPGKIDHHDRDPDIRLGLWNFGHDRRLLVDPAILPEYSDDDWEIPLDAEGGWKVSMFLSHAPAIDPGVVDFDVTLHRISTGQIHSSLIVSCLHLWIGPFRTFLDW